MNENMKKAREAAGFSQKQVALTLNVSAPTVSDWEAGKIYPSAKNLMQLSALYGVPTDYLIGCHGMFGAYLKLHHKNETVDTFAEKCGVSVETLKFIEGVGEKPKGNSQTPTSLGTDDIKQIAKILNVDFNYLACLYDGYNPHFVQGVCIPDDDLTKNMQNMLNNRELSDVNLALFGDSINGIKIASTDLSEEALETAKAYDDAESYVQFVVRKLLGLDVQNEEVRFAARKSNATRSSIGPDTDVEI